MCSRQFLWVILICVGFASGVAAAEITGELKQWHKITLTIDGPEASETDVSPNPFTDYRMQVTFAHQETGLSYEVPGYFCGDGQAGESSATQGNKWRAHVAPDEAGEWSYRVSFAQGKHVALDLAQAGTPLAAADGLSGKFSVAATDKLGRDFRAKGRLQYVGGHYLQFAGSKEYFLKLGPDSPETLLAYVDFDGAETHKVPLKTWQAHAQDWRPGDPSWKGGKGKGLIGALNYLAAKGCNAFSFMPYNVGGDGQNVWPFIASDDKLHYDCSKLDQWQIVMDHAQAQGLYLHFKLQEQENDDHRKGSGDEIASVAAALDGGDVGVERKLYIRELVARFGYQLALNWNLGEENTQSTDQQCAMAEYIRETDPYDHLIVVHTFPTKQEPIYTALLGEQSVLTGASLQNHWDVTHERTLRWVTASAAAGKPWVVANDEQGPASLGVPPDPGFAAFQGRDAKGQDIGYDLHDVRRATLWGNLMAGGAGVEYYFGYQLAENDLLCENFRSRDGSWDYGRIALEFFAAHKVPFWEMTNANHLVGNPRHKNDRYCFAKANEIYLVYLPHGGETSLDLAGVAGQWTVRWFNPRSGGALAEGSVQKLQAGQTVSLGKPPAAEDGDWLVIVKR